MREANLRRKNPLFDWRSAIADSDLPPMARLIAWTLSLHMSSRGDSCFPSLELLATESGLSKPSVIRNVRILQGLDEEGKRILEADIWLEVTPGGGRGKSNKYQAVIPKRLTSVTLSETVNERDRLAGERVNPEPETVKIEPENSNAALPEDVSRTDEDETRARAPEARGAPRASLPDLPRKVWSGKKLESLWSEMWELANASVGAVRIELPHGLTVDVFDAAGEIPARVIVWRDDDMSGAATRFELSTKMKRWDKEVSTFWRHVFERNGESGDAWQVVTAAGYPLTHIQWQRKDDA